MKDWEKYQHQAAALLGELGFISEVNVRLTEANGAANAIDVAARRTVAGVDVLWIVECKHWNKPVDMGAVRDLRMRVLDLGADRGLLMSESGFQSGAVMTAKRKNITLTSLDDLRENAADEILAARVVVAERRVTDLAFKVNDDLRTYPGAWHTRRLAIQAARLPPGVFAEFAARPEASEYPLEMFEDVEVGPDELGPDERRPLVRRDGEWPPGPNWWTTRLLSDAIKRTAAAMHYARLGQWPVFCVNVFDDKSGFWLHPRLAWNMAQLIEVVEPALPVLERKAADASAVEALPASP